MNDYPTETGFYLALSEAGFNKNPKFYDLIVEVFGRSPFFELRCWNLHFSRVVPVDGENSYSHRVHIDNINKFGSRINLEV